MKKLVRVVVFALLMAGAVTASFSSNGVSGSVAGGGGPLPLCDPTVQSCPSLR